VVAVVHWPKQVESDSDSDKQPLRLPVCRIITEYSLMDCIYMYSIDSSRLPRVGCTASHQSTRAEALHAPNEDPVSSQRCDLVLKSLGGVALPLLSNLFKPIAAEKPVTTGTSDQSLAAGSSLLSLSISSVILLTTYYPTPITSPPGVPNGHRYTYAHLKRMEA
jgi:hypothetical protein